MPGNYNRIILVGNLTRDPDLKHLNSGSVVCKFGLAVNKKTKNGEEATFFDIVAWEKLGELCEQYLKKGRSVLVEGRLTIRKYEDKNGAERKAVEVVIDAMQMLDKKNDLEGGASPPYQESFDDPDLDMPF